MTVTMCRKEKKIGYCAKIDGLNNVNKERNVCYKTNAHINYNCTYCNCLFINIWRRVMFVYVTHESVPKFHLVGLIQEWYDWVRNCFHRFKI